MNIGDLVKWESVKNDIEEDFDIDYGIILEFRYPQDQKGYVPIGLQALIQFYDEFTWMSVDNIQIINEQQESINYNNIK